MVSARAVLGLVGKGAAVFFAVVIVMAAVTGGLVVTGVVETGVPSVEEYNTQWQDTTDEDTVIEATVEVNNPNPVGVPEVVDVAYEMQMNDVVVAEGEERGLGLDAGNNDIKFEAAIEGDEISDWWVTHINNDERTDVKVTATVTAPGYSGQFTVKEQTIRTDFLGSIQTKDNQPISLNGRRVAVVEETKIQWGQANDDRTPLKLTATITNTASQPITVRDLRYGVAFNSVMMGEGVADSDYTIQPGETKQVTFTMVLDTTKIEAWWPTHVNELDGSGVEQTIVRTLGAITIEAGGESRTVQLDAMTGSSEINTNFVASDNES